MYNKVLELRIIEESFGCPNRCFAASIVEIKHLQQR